jgi:hypothetical protein
MNSNGVSINTELPRAEADEAVHEVSVEQGEPERGTESLKKKMEDHGGVGASQTDSPPDPGELANPIERCEPQQRKFVFNVAAVRRQMERSHTPCAQLNRIRELSDSAFAFRPLANPLAHIIAHGCTIASGTLSTAVRWPHHELQAFQRFFSD